MTGRGVVRFGCLLGLLCVVAAPREATSFPGRSGEALHSEREATGWLIAESNGMAANPHSDLIFRATGATTCLDCHRAGKDGLMLAQVQDNELVQALRAKAKGIHGPGRFADCLRCHAGGSKGVERYRK